MSDVNFTIGGTPAPFLSAMERVKASAKEGASKVSESFGIEGVKSERALHTRFLGAFNDITKGGTNSAEAIGGAFEQMTEGLKLSMGSMVALLAVSELVKGMYAGYEAAEKMKTSVKDALSINTDVTGQSVEQVQSSIKKLNDDAEANNLGAMSTMQAGATAMVQAFEEGKSISAVVREDAEEYNRLKQEAHDMEDAEGAKAIDRENQILQLRLEGKDKEAESIEKLGALQDKLDTATDKKDQAQIEALNTQIDLTQKLQDLEDKKEYQKQDAKFKDILKQEADEQAQQDAIGATDAQKLAAAQAKTAGDQKKLDAFGEADNQEQANTKEQIRLDILKDQTKEKELQTSIQKKMVEDWQKANDRDFADGKKKAEQEKKFAEDKAKLLKEQSEAQTAFQAASLDATMFNGQVSSLAKVGLGGRVSGANYGNQAQLKAVQESAKHLADIKAAFQKLSGSVGVASS